MGEDGEHGNEVGNSASPGEYVTRADFDRFASRIEAALLTVLASRQEATATSPLQATLPVEDTPDKQSGKQLVMEERPGHPPYIPMSVAGVRFSEETEARLGGSRQVGGIRAMGDLSGPSRQGFEVGGPSRSSGDVFPLAGDQGEYDWDDRQVASRRVSGSRSHFCKEVLEAPVPEGFREPVLSYYSGKEDPLNHIQWFEDVVSIRTMTDAFKCKFFVITFQGKAREWFHHLPPSSIYCFEDLRRGVMTRFNTWKMRKKEATTLFHLSQGEGETLTVDLQGPKRKNRRRNWRQPEETPLFCDIHGVEGHTIMACPDFWEARRRATAGGAAEERKEPQPIRGGPGVELVAQQALPRRRNEELTDQGGRGRLGGGGGAVGVIQRGAGLEASRKGSLYSIYRRSVASTSHAPPPLEEITFSQEDMSRNENPFHDALVIQDAIEDFTVDRILVDNGSSVNVIYKKTFDQLEVEISRVIAADGPLFGFSGEKKEVEGGVDLLVTLGGVPIKCRFVIVDAPSSYSAIFGRPLLNFFKAIPSSYHQCLKFCKRDVQVRIRSDPRAARECYLSAVSTIAWIADAEEMEKAMEGMARLEVAEEVEEVEVVSAGGVPGMLKVGGSLRTEEKIEMEACLQENVDEFPVMPSVSCDEFP